MLSSNIDDDSYSNFSTANTMPYHFPNEYPDLYSQPPHTSSPFDSSSHLISNDVREDAGGLFTSDGPVLPPPSEMTNKRMVREVEYVDKVKKYTNVDCGSDINCGMVYNSQIGGNVVFDSRQQNATESDFLHQGVLGPGPNDVKFTSQETFGPHYYSKWAGPVIFAGPNGSNNFVRFGVGGSGLHGYIADFSSACDKVDSWIPDSGASAHMTGDFSLVFDAIPYTGTERVIIGDDCRCFDEGIGF